MQAQTILLCLAIEVFGVSCPRSPDALVTEAQKNELETTAVRSSIDVYTSALEAGDLETALEQLSEDAVLLEPNRPPILGKAAIRDFAQPLMEKVKISRFETSPEKTVVEGGLGWEWGNYVEFVQLPSGEERKVIGKYSITLQKVENRWQIISMMSSSN